MSGFLVNLARRGAGLIEAPVEAPPISSVRSEIGPQRVGLSEAQGTAREEHPAANAGSDVPLHPSHAQKGVAVAADSSAQNTFSNQASTVIQRSSAARAFADAAPSPEAPPTSTQPLSPVGRETRGVSMKEVKDLGSEPAPDVVKAAKQPDVVVRSHTAQAAITKIQIERGETALEPAGQTLEPLDLRPSLASDIAFSSPMITRAPRETRTSPAKASAGVSADPSVGSLRAGTDELREHAVLSPRIHPAPDESHAPFQFPKVSRALPSEAPSQLPIHVRIGRVEVLPPTSPTASPTTSVNSAPRAGLGFKSYHRVRNYRY